MATLLELLNQGELFRFDPMLGWNEMEMRRIFLLSEARNWLEEKLPTAEATWQIEVNPAEQLDALVYEFCSGKPLQVGTRFKSLVHLGDGIWELKTADLRLFGWFVRKDHFVVSDCDHTDRIKRVNLYRGYCEQAVRRREALNLDEPKYIGGDNPDDVVSDCY
jgi:hypothetical protein